MKKCPYCIDGENFPIELDEDGFCPCCGYYEEEDFKEIDLEDGNDEI